jgi:AcrR family transcriptional regulator
MAEPSRRELILKVADQLLRHYGPQKTTMADVAREANIGVGSVYLEFPSKDALVEALSRSHYSGVLDAMRRAAGEAGPVAAERIVRVLEARAVSFLAMMDGGAHACDLLHCGSEAVKSAQGAYHAEEREILRGIVDDGRRSGDLDVGDVDTTVRVLLLAYASFAPPWIFKLDQKKLGADIGAMHQLVLYGLVRRNGAKKRPGG